jgi:hypothetical protein
MTTATLTAIAKTEQYQDWGKDHPIPELDEMLAALNQGRSRKTSDLPKGKWLELRIKVYRRAAQLLGVESRSTGSGGSDQWNATIDALALYRSDFRGYTVTSPAGFHV